MKRTSAASEKANVLSRAFWKSFKMPSDQSSHSNEIRRLINVASSRLLSLLSAAHNVVGLVYHCLLHETTKAPCLRHEPFFALVVTLHVGRVRLTEVWTGKVWYCPLHCTS